MILLLFIGFILLSLQATSVEAFASYMTHDYCSTEISLGTVIMGKALAYEESPSRSLKVKIGNSDILDNAEIDCSKPIHVYLEPKIYHMVLEVRGPATLEKGLCEGKRSNSNGVRIVVDQEARATGGEISVHGTWAKSYSDGVVLLHPVQFKCKSEAEL